MVAKKNRRLLTNDGDGAMELTLSYLTSFTFSLARQVRSCRTNSVIKLVHVNRMEEKKKLMLIFFFPTKNTLPKIVHFRSCDLSDLDVISYQTIFPIFRLIVCPQ